MGGREQMYLNTEGYRTSPPWTRKEKSTERMKKEKKNKEKKKKRE